MHNSTILDYILRLCPDKKAAEAPVYDGDSHAGLMTTRKGYIKYALDEGGKVQGLNLSDCGLDDAAWQQILHILSEAGCLLRDLNLSGNRITRFSFTPVLETLEHLDLSENEVLKTVEFSGPLPRLERWMCAGSGLRELVVPQLPALKWLDLRRNELARISFEGGCHNLAWLDLSHNQLEALPLKNDNILLCVKDLSDILPNLRHLRLAPNPLPETISSFMENAGADVLEIVKRYLRELEKGPPADDNECKLLLIGNGGVGKTCFKERLMGNECPEIWDSTHGIIIEEQFPLSDWVLNIWDFGGQDIYHATHRLFMQANCVYLLFWDLETEAAKKSPPLHESGEERCYDNYPMTYWLDYAHSRSGGRAPLLLVQTKVNQPQHGKKDLPDIRTRYSGHFTMLEFHHIDSILPDQRKNGYRNLLNDIESAVSALKPAGAVMPANYADIRLQLRDLRKAGRTHLDLEDYLDRARCLDIESPMEVLEKWLTGTGVVFYREGLFNNQIILDQAWAIKAIYTIFDRNKGGYYYEILSRQGRFSGRELERFWADKADSPNEYELFLSFMLSCDLCFETSPDENRWEMPFGERTFIAPQLLPGEKPRSASIVERDWNKYPNLEMMYFHYRHQFLHDGVIQSFIVRTQKLAKVDDIWRNGILLEENGENVLIERVDRNDILVKAPVSAIRLFEKVINLLRELKESEATELVSYDGAGYVHFDQLQQWPRQNPIIPGLNNEPLEFVRFAHFLHLNAQASFERPEYQDEKPDDSSKATQPSIFFSYAWGEEREQVVNDLHQALQEDGFRVVRDKQDLAYGGLISEFMERIGRGDWVVVFISDKYVRSEYCMFELYEIARNSKLEKLEFAGRILPVIVEFIDFKQPKVLDGYFDHWEKKEKEWEELVTKRVKQIGTQHYKQYERIKNINSKVSDLTSWLGDINALNPIRLAENNFEVLKKEILQRMEKSAR
jgi:GTPase SAR1 family protein